MILTDSKFLANRDLGKKSVGAENSHAISAAGLERSATVGTKVDNFFPFLFRRQKNAAAGL
jgi:hypothetical protein